MSCQRYPEPSSSIRLPLQLSMRPQLIYAGDCGFCAYWARYWQQLAAGQWWDWRLTALYFPKARLRVKGE
jgi:hypothetical protein